MFDPEHTEENEQQKLDEARGGDDSIGEDSDYFSFDQVRDRALGSESTEETLAGATLWMIQELISLIQAMS